MTAPGEFYVLLTGDPQYNWMCTPENAGCHAAVPCTSETDDDCTAKQSKYNTNTQEISLHSLIANMSAQGIRPKGTTYTLQNSH